MVLLNKRSFLMVMAMAALVASSIACNLPKRTRETPTPIPLSGSSVEELATQVAAAASAAASGDSIVLEFTEEQLTTAAALELQSQGETNIRDVQITLLDNQIQITGSANQNGFDLPVSIALRLTVDEQGRPHSQIIEAKVGPLSLPQSMIDQFTTGFDQLLTAKFAEQAGDIVIDSIDINDGKMTIVAHRR
jgi:uncharacterized protein YpmS